MSLEISDFNLMESPPDKVVLVGDVGVGKTSLFLRFKTGEFSESTSHNPREGEYHKKWQVNGSEVSVSEQDISLSTQTTNRMQGGAKISTLSTSLPHRYKHVHC